MRYRLPIAALVAAIPVIIGSVTLGALWAFKADRSSAGSGPLVRPSDSKVSLGAPIPMGRDFSYGLLALKNNSSKPVVIDRLRLVDASPEIRFLGAYVLPTPNTRGIGFVEGFTPSPTGLLPGQRVAPYAEVQVIIGVKLDTPGKYVFRGIALDYHGASKTFAAEYPASLRLCAPVRRYRDRCPSVLDSETATTAGVKATP
jgi:hypothetical protein